MAPAAPLTVIESVFATVAAPHAAGVSPNRISPPPTTRVACPPAVIVALTALVAALYVQPGPLGGGPPSPMTFSTAMGVGIEPGIDVRGIRTGTAAEQRVRLVVLCVERVVAVAPVERIVAGTACQRVVLAAARS